MGKTILDWVLQSGLAICVGLNVYAGTGSTNLGSAAFCFCVLLIVKD